MINTIVPTKRLAPWIGIGVAGEWHDYRDALEASDLMFEVEAKDALVEHVEDPIVFYDPVPGYQVNVRKDNHRILGCVSSRYSVVQNIDAFQLLKPFTDAGGIITNAGMTEQGLCFMVLRMNQANYLGDDYEFNVMCTNSFNGLYPLSLIITPTRIICQNMYRKLMGNHDSLLHVRHKKEANNRLEAAVTATTNVALYMDKFATSIENAYNLELPEPKLEEVIAMLFPYPKPGGTREETFKAKTDLLRKEFVDRYYCTSDNMKFHGTAMGFINAYYDYLSHHDPSKNMPGSWADRRFTQIMAGTSINTKALKEVLS